MQQTSTPQLAPPLGLYIHIPWCVKKCPYCDFNSHTAHGDVPESRYIQALMSDLDQDLALIKPRQLHSIFIGGGTPSLFSPESIEALLIGVRDRLEFGENIEITLEANPGTLEKNKFNEFKNAGINRLSIGVQSFDQQRLKKLGRIHNATEAIRAAETAHDAGLSNFNLDLMYGLPDQDTKSALDDVITAVSLNPAHISYYQLTIEPNTLFHATQPQLPSDDLIWQIQSQGQDFLRTHGYSQYEISAYAKINAQCQHNLNYWQFGDYLGIGAGAHGKITQVEDYSIQRTWKIKHPTQYLERVETDARIGNRYNIPNTERPLEFLMNALRLNQGFTESLFNHRTGLTTSILEPNLTACTDQGLLQRQSNRIRCSEQGRNFLNEILQRFMPSN